MRSSQLGGIFRSRSFATVGPLVAILASLAMACEPGSDGPPPSHVTTMRARLKGAALLAVVAGPPQAAQVARSAAPRPGVRKDGNGPPLCQDLPAAELVATDSSGAYVNDCENPTPPADCQDLDPDRVATGRVVCIERPAEVGDLIAVTQDGRAFQVLPSLPAWNRVTRVQQAGTVLLVTLALPVKLLRSDGATEYCNHLFYHLDLTADSLVPYCYHYEYNAPFCFGPEQLDEQWASPDTHSSAPFVLSDVPLAYEERVVTFDASPEVCVEVTDLSADYPFYRRTTVSPGVFDGIHVTPHATFEAVALEQGGTLTPFTRIVAGDQDTLYPMEIHFYGRRGIVSAGTYYTFDAQGQSLTGSLSGRPLSWDLGRPMLFETSTRILYGLYQEAWNMYVDVISTPWDATTLEVDAFDTQSLTEETLAIDIRPLSAGLWTFLGTAGDYLFLHHDDSGRFYRVDTAAPAPVTEVALETAVTVPLAAMNTVALNSYTLNYSTRYDASQPFAAFLMKPDGSMLEVNAALLGFNPQTVTLEDDQIIVSGMAGLTPRTYVLNPLATEAGDLVVETQDGTVVARTLIPLE